jgi:predicted nucleic acid-binding protein
VSDVWVANASPVITLAKAGHLDLLTKLANELWVPDAVVAEVLAGPAADPARLALEAGWGMRDSPKHISQTLVEWALGAGETAVLAFAQERLPCTVLLDDAMARTCARAFHVPVIGTLGVVLRAKKAGHVVSAAEVIVALKQSGLHLDDAVIRMALGRVGEKWPP